MAGGVTEHGFTRAPDQRTNDGQPADGLEGGACRWVRQPGCWSSTTTLGFARPWRSTSARGVHGGPGGHGRAGPAAGRPASPRPGDRRPRAAAMDGLDVVRGLRGWTSVPIVVLSGCDTEAVKVQALDLGADDYVAKPFGMDELSARLRAAMRRAVLPEGQAVVATPDSRSTSRPSRPPEAARRSGSPRGSGTSSRSWSATPAGWSPTSSSSTRSGDPTTAPRPATSACS